MIDINNIKHKRIFCFGCSFTAGCGTWADILKRHFGDYPKEDFYIPKDQPQMVYNFGMPGMGNFYIFNTIIEKSLHYEFTKDDLILIEWSGTDREDRYKDGKWHMGMQGDGSRRSKAVIRDWFLDIEGMIKRDYSYIRSTQKMLKADNIDYEMFSMNGVSRHNPIIVDKEMKNKKDKEEIDFLIELYKGTLDELHPSMFKIIFGDETVFPPNREDPHPTPVEHLYYLEKVFNFKPSDELRTHTEMVTTDLDYSYLNSLYLELDHQEFFMKLKSKYYDRH
jgi:hypothetical protein